MSTRSPLKKSILQQSISVAMASDAPKKMGAVLLDKKNRVIATGTNSYVKTHPVQYWAAQNAAKIWGENGLSEKVYLHAETRVLIKSKEDADTIVVCRVGGHGGRELRNARPCRICTHLILNCTTIQHVHYSTQQGFMYEYWGDSR
jgi:deoxycytidylate deaminase